MTFVDRRRHGRELPPPPEVAPDPEPGAEASRRAEVLRQDLQRHPGLANPRLLGLAEALGAGRKGGEYLAALRPLWHSQGSLASAPPPAQASSETPVRFRPALEEVPVAALDAAWETLCEAAGGAAPAESPCKCLAIALRVRKELHDCGNPWVTAGGLGVGLPLAWVILARSVLRATEKAALELPEEVPGALRAESERERQVLNANLGALAPYLHDGDVAGCVRLGAERFLDGWQVMLNGLDHRVFGGLVEL